MLGFFPDPYPDEILYSICARYAERVKYPNRQKVNLDLFGREDIIASVDFPTRLDNLVASLRTEKYSSDQFIDENTIYPFFEPFISIDRSKMIRHEMKNENYNRLRARLSTNIHQVTLPKFLRFCPLCVNQDRAEFGETYWHRSHQLSGVLVCPKHNCYLENSLARRDKKLSLFYRVAEEYVYVVLPKLIDPGNSEDRLFTSIANLSQWFLEQNNLCLEGGELRQRLYDILLQRGYAFYSRKTKNRKLVNLLNEKFSSKSLEILGCTIKSLNQNWLSKLLAVGMVRVLHHPLRYFLLMIMLDIDPADVFIRYKEYKPFGDAPYPCLNRVADHYLKPTINSVQIFHNLAKDRKKQGIPLGIFSCECGFIYQRLGPDTSAEDKFKFSLIRDYGNIWEDKFSEMWKDLSFSNTEIGRQTGISQTSVGRIAIKLKLPMNTKNARTLQGYRRHRNPNKGYLEKLQQYRKQWLTLIKNNPNISRMELIDLKPYTHNWLRRNDTEWFETHSPAHIRWKGFTDLKNWNEIDKSLAKEVREICNEIYNLKSFPIRVSLAEIEKRTGKKNWLQKRAKKLPVTTKVLEENLESLEEYMVRKVNYTKNLYQKEKKLPTRPQFQVRAVLKNKTSAESKRVQKEIDEAMSFLTEWL